MKILLVGLKDGECEEVGRWIEAREGRVWSATSGLSALRVFEEFEPNVVVLSTMLPDIDSVRLARTLRAWNPSLRIVFVGAHRIEANYFSSIEGLPGGHYAHRPIDPEAALGLEPVERTLRGQPLRGEGVGAPLVSTLFALLREGASGALYAGAGPDRRVVYVEQGRPVYAASMIASETFGQMLLAAGRISRVEFDWARTLQAREGIQQGHALMHIGVLSETELDERLQEQIREKLLALFSMADVRWHFEPWDRPLRQIRGYDFPPFGLFLDGCRRAGTFASLDPSTSVQLQGNDDDPAYRAVCEALDAEAVAGLLAPGTIAVLAERLGDLDEARVIVGLLQAAGLTA